MKKVMCFGTFDILHLGHLHYFRQAKKYGDYLIVVIARDITKKAQKKRIIFNESERQELVQSLTLVDKAVLGYPDNHFRVIQEQQPDLICLGYDHPVREQWLRQRLAALNLYPAIKRMKAYHPKIFKSSKIKEIVLKYD